MSVQNKTMAMKARVANKLRRKFHEMSNIPENPYYKKGKKEFIRRVKEKIKDKNKIVIFDEIWDAVYEMHTELTAYRHKRKRKAIIEKDRIERGYYITGKGSKKKITKEEYLKTQIKKAS